MEEDKLNSMFLLYRKKLEKVVDTDLTAFFNDVGDKLKVATFSPGSDSGSAYDGALVFTVLQVISRFAFGLNSILPQDKQVDEKSLIKVCLLQHVSKMDMFIHTNDDWKRKKGILYDFSDNNTALRTGLKSVLICQRYGISFTDEEVDAMTIIDRDDDQAKFFASMLAVIVRQANELAMFSLRNK